MNTMEEIGILAKRSLIVSGLNKGLETPSDLSGVECSFCEKKIEK